MGGHNVPSMDVRRRYTRSIKNFKDVIPLVDHWELYYNGENNYELVAQGSAEILDILNDVLYNKFNKESK